ncbi:hypothetical protein TorRG33x02_023590 [Trema orientale]|uniref:Uncharacterized protein n=1 Tax=Trema orientale TaxID=63057 RepID=A0A2P5FUW4_TREOI|nr:hypothetical protein TorRG33x02_023590 [Trema orientale]
MEEKTTTKLKKERSSKLETFKIKTPWLSPPRAKNSQSFDSFSPSIIFSRETNGAFRQGPEETQAFEAGKALDARGN